LSDSQEERSVGGMREAPRGSVKKIRQKNGFCFGGGGGFGGGGWGGCGGVVGGGGWWASGGVLCGGGGGGLFFGCVCNPPSRAVSHISVLTLKYTLEEEKALRKSKL